MLDSGAETVRTRSDAALEKAAIPSLHIDVLSERCSRGPRNMPTARGHTRTAVPHSERRRPHAWDRSHSAPPRIGNSHSDHAPAAPRSAHFSGMQVTFVQTERRRGLGFARTRIRPGATKATRCGRVRVPQRRRLVSYWQRRRATGSCEGPRRSQAVSAAATTGDEVAAMTGAVGDTAGTGVAALTEAAAATGSAAAAAAGAALAGASPAWRHPQLCALRSVCDGLHWVVHDQEYPPRSGRAR